jgi:nitroreductase
VSDDHQTVPIGEDAPIMTVMATMRAMRRLRPDPVPDDVLERLVEAATWGPSGSNSQGYQFVVVTDRDVMAELAVLWRRCVDAYLASVGRRTPAAMDAGAYERMKDAVRYQRDHFHETPAVIVPCYSYPTSFDPAAVAGLASLGPAAAARLAARMPRFASLAGASSIYPGIQNLLLAARAMGLAATLTIWHLMLEHEWKRVLGIPRQVDTYAVIPVGWPLGRFGTVRRRPAREVTHWQGW